jgi:spermidine synthase
LAEPTILDLACTDIGTFYLSRRESSATPELVYEILIGDEVLMSSLDPVSERRLSTSALALHKGTGPLRILVGGLGLGHTAEAALADPRVASVRVVEKMRFVMDWMNEGQLPLSSLFQTDARVVVSQGDVYAELLGEASERYDLILIDVDHAPDDPLSEQSAAFYTASGQRAVARHLLPGGILGIWSAAENEGFSRVLAEVYSASHSEEVYWQDLELPEADFQNLLFFALVA